MRIVFKPMGVAVVLAAVFGLAAWCFRLTDRPTGKQVAPPPRPILPISLAKDAPNRWAFEQLAPNSGSFSVSTPPEGPVGKEPVGKISVTKPSPQKPEHVQVYCVLAKSYTLGQILRVRFWARSPESKPCLVLFGQNRAPYEKDMIQRVSVTPEWKMYECFVPSSGAHPAKGARLSFQVGDSAGTFEFTGVEVHDPAAP